MTSNLSRAGYFLNLFELNGPAPLEVRFLFLDKKLEPIRSKSINGTQLSTQLPEAIEKLKHILWPSVK